MDILENLWNYQNAELAYEDFENVLKNTETRKKMLQYQKLFTTKQAALKQLESESAVLESKLAEIVTIVNDIAQKMEQKKQELSEMEGYDLEDLFLQDVKESVKECENTKGKLDQLKKKTVDVKKRIEAVNEEILKTLRTMSAAKKEFDKLKAEYNKDIEASAEEIEKLKNDIKLAAEKVDPALLEKYKKVKARWRNPVVKLNNDRCSGCNMQLPVSVIGKLKVPGTVVECDSCGRILYYV